MLAAVGTPILPPWLVLPAAAATMLVIAAHILLMPTLPMPASRRRIRTVNGFLMLFATALLGYAFGMATQAAPRTFVLVWSVVVVLLTVIVALACIDVLNTLRLGMQERRTIKAGLKSSMDRDLAERVGGLTAPAEAPLPPPAAGRSGDGRA